TQLTQNGAIDGTGALTKAGTGTLTLAGQNTYTGGTSLDGGVVQISADANLGAATGPLSFNGGTLRTTADMSMSRATTLDTSGGIIETMPGTQLTQNGTIGGTGALTKAGTGTLVLSAANVYAGGTSLNGGVVQVSSDANLGAATGPLSFNGGTLRTTADMTMSRATTLDAGGGTIDTMPATQLTQNGAIGGTGALTKIGTGTL
ncbi:autotransporter-associated beta strand repeat-containing protein, partial [Pararobbsia alpina]|uniref:autotransporter-associated beta strand repeat-containing protein n=1 Tax=Pararobbsia alpina TaxID=621374 RepID=UPI001582B322